MTLEEQERQVEALSVLESHVRDVVEERKDPHYFQHISIHVRVRARVCVCVQDCVRACLSACTTVGGSAAPLLRGCEGGGSSGSGGGGCSRALCACKPPPHPCQSCWPPMVTERPPRARSAPALPASPAPLPQLYHPAFCPQESYSHVDESGSFHIGTTHMRPYVATDGALHLVADRCGACAWAACMGGAASADQPSHAAGCAPRV